MGKFWKYFWAIFGLNLLLGNAIFDGRKKGGIGCGWVAMFGFIFFPLWLIYKLIAWMLKLIFFRR